MEKSHLWVRPSSLLTILTFPHGGRQTQRYFNVSPPSSRRNNKAHMQKIYSHIPFINYYHVVGGIKIFEALNLGVAKSSYFVINNLEAFS